MNNIISNKTVFLIDGSYYIFRAYYGFSSSILNEGAPMNAVYGFTLMLFNFLKKYKPYYLAIAFDSKAPTFRKKIYKLYKSNRLPTPNNLISQFIFIYKIVNAFNIKSLIKDGYEADDLIGTVTKFFKNANKTVVIVSSDKDFMQLVDQNVFLLKKIKKNGLNHDVIIKNREVIKKFGVSPKHVIDVLALAGDSSDNIPGVRGIGMKTASALIKQYGSVEEVLKYTHLIRQKIRRERLMLDSEKALLSKRLATINCNVKLPIKLSDLKMKNIVNKKLIKLLKTFDFTDLLNKYVY